MLTGMIDVKIGRRTVRFNRDRLATAILLRMDHPNDAPAVAQALMSEYGVEKTEAIALTIATRVCAEQGIEP